MDCHFSGSFCTQWPTMENYDYWNSKMSHNRGGLIVNRLRIPPMHTLGSPMTFKCKYILINIWTRASSFCYKAFYIGKTLILLIFYFTRVIELEEKTKLTVTYSELGIISFSFYTARKNSMNLHKIILWHQFIHVCTRCLSIVYAMPPK